MGIKFTCPACGRALNVKSELAGKRGRCPQCQAKIVIPTQSGASSDSAVGESQAGAASPMAPAPAMPEANPAASSSPIASAGPIASDSPAASPGPVPSLGPSAPSPAAPSAAFDPIAEAPHLQWYAMPPGAANQYGPAGGEEFHVWMQEGRITADALVWRQDWPDWKRAGAVFPQLEAPAPVGASTAAPLAAPPAMPLPTAVAAMPMTAGMPPVAQPVFPVAGVAPGMFLAAGPMASPAAEGFPVTPDRPAAMRGRDYRQKSNAGPIIAIVVLLLAMIPLSFFVWKVVSEQIGSAPPAATAGPKDAEE